MLPEYSGELREIRKTLSERDFMGGDKTWQRSKKVVRVVKLLQDHLDTTAKHSDTLGSKFAESRVELERVISTFSQAGRAMESGRFAAYGVGSKEMTSELQHQVKILRSYLSTASDVQKSSGKAGKIESGVGVKSKTGKAGAVGAVNTKAIKNTIDSLESGIKRFQGEVSSSSGDVNSLGPALMRVFGLMQRGVNLSDMMEDGWVDVGKGVSRVSAETKELNNHIEKGRRTMALYMRSVTRAVGMLDSPSTPSMLTDSPTMSLDWQRQGEFRGMRRYTKGLVDKDAIQKSVGLKSVRSAGDVGPQSGPPSSDPTEKKKFLKRKEYFDELDASFRGLMGGSSLGGNEAKLSKKIFSMQSLSDDLSKGSKDIWHQFQWLQSKIESGGLSESLKSELMELRGSVAETAWSVGK